MAVFPHDWWKDKWGGWRPEEWRSCDWVQLGSQTSLCTNFLLWLMFLCVGYKVMSRSICIFLKNVESRICQMKTPLYALPWKLLQCSDFVLNEPLFWVFTFNLWNIESLSMWKQLNPNELMGQRYYISLHQHISCKPLGRRLHQLEGLPVSREFIWADRRVWERRARSGWHAVSGSLRSFMVSAQESTVAL